MTEADFTPGVGTGCPPSETKRQSPTATSELEVDTNYQPDAWTLEQIGRVNELAFHEGLATIVFTDGARWQHPDLMALYDDTLIYLARKSYIKPDNPRFLMHVKRVVLDLCIDDFRRHTGRGGAPTISLEILDQEVIEKRRERFRAQSIAIEGPEGEVTTRILLEQLLGQLSLNHRRMITLVYFLGLEVKEAAEILGTSPETGRTRIYYALKHLREHAEAQGLTLNDFLSSY